MSALGARSDPTPPPRYRRRVTSLRLRVLGCGDAFSSGGRLHPCFHLHDGRHSLLIDCGASALAALRREGLDPGSIGWVAISHLHGDHFGGLPWLLLDGRYHGRQLPLQIAGPSGLSERVAQAFSAFYPGAAEAQTPFGLSYCELREGQTQQLGPALLTPFATRHESGAPSLALRIELAGRVIAYSGDTEWTDALPALARGADLFICECSFYDERVPGHLDYRTLAQKRPLLECRRLLLTHLGEQMLARAHELEIPAAHDGMAIEL